MPRRFLANAESDHRKDREPVFSSHDSEVTQVERQHASLGSFRAGNHGRVSEAQGQVGVALRELPDRGKIVLAAIESIGSGLDVRKEEIKNSKPEPLFDQIGDLRKNSRGDEIRDSVLRECFVQDDTSAFRMTRRRQFTRSQR